MPAPADAIRFLLDDTVTEVRGLAPTTTVLEYLREHCGRTGTKEGCAEGDCGACTVVVGELDGEAIRYRAVNSCIRFLPTLDGKALVTVEQLADGDVLHPVQQAMVDQHASQCGFCTPGFVMSLFALYQADAAPARDSVVDALAGNLCRCTGYRPIIDAGCAMSAYAEPAHWSRADAQSDARVAALRGLQRDATLALPGFHAPRSLDALASLLESEPGSQILAGGTDVGLWVTKHLRELAPIVYLGEVVELQRIEHTGDGALRIGAAVTLTDGWAAIVRERPALAELAQRFASPPVRNSGTLVGNLANGSPIGDATPALIALGATVELRLGARVRTLALEDLYLDYMKKDLAPGEFLAAVTIPAPREGAWLAAYKLSKRVDQDISAVCLAIALHGDADQVHEARLGVGGMAAVASRAPQTEAALRGRKLDAASIEAACTALAADFTPLSDMRASAAYRLEAAQNLLRRCLIEHAEAHSSAAPLRTHAAPVAP